MQIVRLGISILKMQILKKIGEDFTNFGERNEMEREWGRTIRF